MTDPTDDANYVGLSLADYLRHFVPQAEQQRLEIKEINELGKKPFFDAAFPETMAPEDRPATDRQSRRLAKRKEEKAKKKKVMVKTVLK